VKVDGNGCADVFGDLVKADANDVESPITIAAAKTASPTSRPGSVYLSCPHEFSYVRAAFGESGAATASTQMWFSFESAPFHSCGDIYKEHAVLLLLLLLHISHKTPLKYTLPNGWFK
jgi:hypothetical protein